MAAEAGSVRVKCTHCEAAQVIDDKRLGTKVECKSCQDSFDAGWGEPVMTLPGADGEAQDADSSDEAAEQSVDASSDDAPTAEKQNAESSDR